MQDDNNSEVSKFFDGLPSDDGREENLFKKTTEQVEDTPVKEDEDEEPRKNRRHRRLEQQLQQERESSIALNERVKTMAEMLKDRDAEKEKMAVDDRLTRLFGADENGKEISRHFTKILEETKFEAEENALKRFNEQQLEIANEEKQYESFIDEQLEAIEDEHGIDLTSDAPKARKARREFLGMVQDLSPKNGDGTITDYADFGSVFDVYQKTQIEKPDESLNRRKEIASRSMQRSGSINYSKENDDTNKRFLRENGIRI